MEGFSIADIKKLSDVITFENNKKKCPYCFCKGDLMGDDEDLFECIIENSHIWSIHSSCKSEKHSLFLGWIPRQDDDDLDNDGTYTSSYMKNHKRYCVTYNPKDLQDLSVFLWKCENCKEEYVTMMCG